MEQNIEPISLLIKAVSFAAEKHRHQRRKDVHASPYINHPISLANILTNEGRVTDINVLCAALLHDTIEDTDTSYDELVDNFGEHIASIVLEVTDDKALPKLERKRLQVEHAPHKSEQAKLVKWADKISNLRDIANSPPTDWSIERKQEYFDWAKNVVDGMRGINPGLEMAFDSVYSDGIN
jgi:GTP diphosphokinase / guanosine-3',5'-bis(diphosphate) 3'-diphosphatase